MHSLLLSVLMQFRELLEGEGLLCVQVRFVEGL
jgi:hypothetical protein